VPTVQFFAEREKGANNMSAQRISGEIPETTNCFYIENSKRLQGDQQKIRRVSTSREAKESQHNGN
jgi:hypothetical protein